MIDEKKAQTFDEALQAFYPAAETEPLEAPTDEAAADEKPEETEELDTEELAEDETEDTEESESEDEETDDTEDAETIEIDGTEHNLTDVEEWKQAHDNVKLMQADCTKKWQEASDLKKDAEAEIGKAQELTLELEALIAEDSDVDLAELKEFEPEKYIEVTEKLAKRKAKLKELKDSQPVPEKVLSKDEQSAESDDFYSYDPKWIDDGKLTEAFSDDMKVAGEYMKKAGYSQEETNAIKYSHHWKTIIDASKHNAKKTKSKAIKKKLIKTPKASKPKANKSTNNLAPHEVMYGKQG
jgi:hypothetical protein